MTREMVEIVTLDWCLIRNCAASGREGQGSGHAAANRRVVRLASASG